MADSAPTQHEEVGRHFSKRQAEAPCLLLKLGVRIRSQKIEGFGRESSA